MIDNYHNRMNIPAMRLPGNLDYNNNYNLYQGNPLDMNYTFHHYYITHPHNRLQGVEHNTVVGHNMEHNTERNTVRNTEHNTVRNTEHNKEHNMGHNMVHNMVHSTHNMAHNRHSMVHSMVRSTPLHIITDVDLGP
jgi:hypothetical protein